MNPDPFLKNPYTTDKSERPVRMWCTRGTTYAVYERKGGYEAMADCELIGVFGKYHEALEAVLLDIVAVFG